MDLPTFFTTEVYRVGDQPVLLGSLIIAATVTVVSIFLLPRVHEWVESEYAGKNDTNRRFLKISSYLLYAVVGLFLVHLLGLYDLFKYQISSAHKEVGGILDFKLFALGKTSITIWTCIYVFVLSWLLIRATEETSAVVSGKLLSRTKLDRGIVEMCSSWARYVVMAIGVSVILQSAGIDLSALSFIAGAAGIAIGLGLQGLMNNVVSGFVILVDRPIKIGDRIDIGGVNGEVTHISLRATTIVTNDNIAVIVPNSQFISSQVVNWTYKTRKCRFMIPLSIAREASISQIQKLLNEVAREHPGVLKTPAPRVALDEIGDTKLKFMLALWTVDYVGRPNELRSDINFAIAEKFAKKGLALDGMPEKKQAPAAADKSKNAA